MPIKNLREDRRPADLWFWSDWFSSFDVRACSLAAQGLWMNMLGIMSRSETKGSLTINGKQIGSKILANILGKPEAEIIPLLKELGDLEVYSILEDGTIVNRRMLREGELSRKRAEAGRLGGAKSKQNTSNDGSKAQATLDTDNEDEDETIKEIEKAWNDFAHKHDIPWINSITKGSARERALLARLHAPDWDLNKLLEAIAAQPFLMGDNPRGWLISFDWVLKPANLQKVMEGVYTKKIKGDRVGDNK